VIQMTLPVNRSDDFGGVATGVSQSRKDGRVEFGLVLKALFKIKNYVYHSGWTSLKVVCHPLRFAVSPNDYNTTTPGILLEGLTCNTVY
jgi:phage-related protein